MKRPTVNRTQITIFPSVSHHGYKTQAPVVQSGRCCDAAGWTTRNNIKPSVTCRSERACSTFKKAICSSCSLDSVGLGSLQLLPLFTYDPPFAFIFKFFACKCQMFLLPSNQRGEGGAGHGEWLQRVWMPGSHFCRKMEWWVIAYAVIIPLSTCPLLALSLTLSVTATFHVGNVL